MSKKTWFFLLGIAVLYIEIVASCGHKGNKWDRLLESNNPFYGNRYVNGSDIATRVLFDSSGKLAGIQATITESDQLIPSPTRPRPSAFVPDDHGNYLLTAYFTKKPQDICKKRHRRSSKDDDTLVLQMSDVRWCKPQFMEIPLDEKNLGTTKWVKGKCVTRMGVHYWYDTSKEMHCDQALPVFLLYDQASQRLKAFGWATLANIESPLWEHPRAPFLQLNFTGSCKNVSADVLNCMNLVVEMYDGYASVAGRDGSFQIGLRQHVGARYSTSTFFFEVVPTCVAKLAEQNLISTQHIYLTDPSKLICT